MFHPRGRRAGLVVAIALAAGCDESGDVARLERQLATLQQELDAARTARDGRAEADDQLAMRLAEVERELASTRARLDAVEAANRRPTTTTYRPRPQPDPGVRYSVPVHDSPVAGPKDALVTIVVAGEYACPYCAKARDTLAELRKAYPKQVRIIHKHFVVHPQTATTPALAACAAHRQGKHAAMDDRLWEVAFGQRRFDEATMVELARELKLDVKRFERDLRGPDCADEVRRDQDALTAVGVRATPTFYINGRHLSGAQPIDAFRRLVDDELKAAESAIAGGVDPAGYYDYLVRTGVPRFDPPPP